MFSKKKLPNEIDKTKLNELINLSHSILKILFILLIVVGLYAFTMLFKELKIWAFILNILRIVSPLFVGIIIAWLLDPLINWLQKKGIRRSIGAIICYIIFLGLLALIVMMIIPLLSNEINDFAGNIPEILNELKIWIAGFINRFDGIQGLDVENIKTNLLENIEGIGASLTSSLPSIIVGFVSGLFSFIGILIVGLIIGFYLIISFDNVGENVLNFLPKKMQKDTKDLIKQINIPLRKFVLGAFFDCLLIFVIMFIGFSIIGLKASFLFALFCGMTNVIPYAGPYIGGLPAVIVAFSQGPLIGTLVLILIIVVQFVEGNLLQPLIMSKTTKLHPVTILLGLLIFGYFFGIVGMIISTPIIGVIKALFMFFNEKYKILNFD